jgi:hypothetical protein
MRRPKPGMACVLALVAGCMDGALLPPRSADDPSNPLAPEAPATTAPTVARPLDAGAATAEHGPYVCPMHADVVRDVPGACPKCGMALVPAEGGAR